MTMEAKFSTDSEGNIIVHMEGDLNYENGMPLRRRLIKLRSENPISMITLDFFHVNFVGSSGIGTFVETVNLLNTENLTILLTNVKSEFIKVFKLYNLRQIEKVVVEYEESDQKQQPNLST